MKPRKRFGQHFLHDEAVLQNIERVVNLQKDDCTFEIGPGQGALTDFLFDSPRRYVAVELDRDLVPHLQARYPAMELVSADILEVDLGQLLADDEGWRVVGNLPYNISSPLIMKMVELAAVEPHVIADMHFMLQREMAARLAATPDTKAWGRLSVMTQLRYEVELLFDVAPESFHPPPKVWSSVLRLWPKLEQPQVDVKQLDSVLKLAFSARRKRLSNALKSLSLDWDALSVQQSVRADSVTIEQFLEITAQTSELDKSETSDAGH